MTNVLEQLRRYQDGKPVLGAVGAAQAARPQVGAYQRISDAYESIATGVTTDGIDRQAQSCEHTAASRHWDVVRTYVDNNVSAFKTTVRRDAFEQMLADLDAGVIDGIVCYNLDRFARRVDDLERALAIYDRGRREGRVMLFASAEGDIDLASDSGLTMARVLVAFANKASRDTARRVAAKQQATRDSGRQVSGARPFGWDIINERRELNEVEAAAIRWAASGLTSGALTWRAVVREWNERGLATPRGGKWQPQTVKQVMHSPRLAGWVVHKDSIAVHSRTGELVRGSAPAILVDSEYEALLTATQSVAGNFTSASGRRKYLLAGIARCQACGGRMVGNAQPNGRHVYRCGDTNCGKVTCSGQGLDDHVSGLTLPRLIVESKRLRLIDLPPNNVERHELEAERAELIESHAAGDRAADLVFPRISVIDDRLAVIRQVDGLHNLAQHQLHGARITANSWGKMGDDDRRMHLERHIEAVYVSPRLRNTGRFFDVERVSQPVWRRNEWR